MPGYTPLRKYTLSATQVDLILYCLESASNLTAEEDNERRKIADILYGSGELPPTMTEDPYQNLCDI